MESSSSDKKGKDSSTKGKKTGENKDIVTESNALSEEDKALKERLETCVTTLTGKQIGEEETETTTATTPTPMSSEEPPTTLIQLKALQIITTELRSATSSMTSVPKPLKFLRPHYDDLVKFGKDIVTDDGDNASSGVEKILLKARMADVLSVLAMTFGNSGTRCVLLFCIILI